jgi:hypothetical protein
VKKDINYTDLFRGQYHTAAESEEPGYLARRLELYERLSRMRERARNEASISAANNRKRVEG